MTESQPTELLTDINELRSRLNENNVNYLLMGNLPAGKVKVCFEGLFEARPVVWNACIYTINEYSKNHQLSDDPKQFIDIKVVDNSLQLEVGLNVKQIDQATVERTIIMIRKYKRLHIGRHEYGVRSKTE